MNLRKLLDSRKTMGLDYREFTKRDGSVIINLFRQERI